MVNKTLFFILIILIRYNLIRRNIACIIYLALFLYFVCFLDSLSLLGESDEYLEQEGFFEEDELISGEDVMPDTMNSSRHQLKRRRVFKAPKERQRGKTKRSKVCLTHQVQFFFLAL